MHFLSASSFPHLARYVRGELPKAANRAKVLAALAECGRVTPEYARRVLRSGTELTLAVIDRGPGRYGYYPGIGDAIQVALVIARQYDGLKTLAPQPGRRSHDWHQLVSRADAMIEAIILHNVVNWTASKTPSPPKKTSLMRPQTEPGDDFEVRAYGSVVSRIPIDGWMGWSYTQDGDAVVATPYDRQAGYPPVFPPRDAMSELSPPHGPRPPAGELER